MAFEYWNLKSQTRLNLSLHVYNQQGILVFSAVPVLETKWKGRPFPKGLFRDVCYIPGDLLNDGLYYVELLVVRDESIVIFSHHNLLVFDVLDSAELRGAWHGKFPGTVRLIFKWKTELVRSDE